MSEKSYHFKTKKKHISIYHFNLKFWEMEDQELYFQKIPKTRNRLFHPNQAIFRVAAVYVETPIATYWSFCGDRSQLKQQITSNGEG